jgi:hypothetical protein
MPRFWQGNGTNPAPMHTPDPKFINLYAEVLCNHCVTSDEHFRRGALISPFWGKLGWPDQ